MNRMKSLAGFGMILGLALLAAEAPATTFYVATNGSNTPGPAGTGLRFSRLDLLAAVDYVFAGAKRRPS